MSSLVENILFVLKAPPPPPANGIWRAVDIAANITRLADGIVLTAQLQDFLAVVARSPDLRDQLRPEWDGAMRLIYPEHDE